MARNDNGITILEINQEIETEEMTTGALILYATELALDLSDEFDCSKDMTFALVGCDLRTNPDDLTLLEEPEYRANTSVELTKKLDGKA